MTTPSPDLALQRLKADGTTRAARTLVQGLYVDLAVAVASFILGNIPGVDLGNKGALRVVGLALLKTLIMSTAAYIFRVYGDASKLFTGPLPSVDVGPPAQDVTPPVTSETGNPAAYHHESPAAEQTTTPADSTPAPVGTAPDTSVPAPAADPTTPAAVTDPVPQPGTRAYALWLDSRGSTASQA